MNRERVQMLRDMIAGIPRRRIFLDSYYEQRGKPCNTIACIAGWAAIYPPFIKAGFNSGALFLSDEAAKFFEISIHTFRPRQFSGEQGTDKDIALRRLDHLLKARTDSDLVEAK